MMGRIRFQLRLVVMIGFVMLAMGKPFDSLAQQTPGATMKDTASNAATHDGQHDFDFNFGTWRTHIRRLQKPLSGSGTWSTMEGTVTVLKIWGGQGQVEDIEADGQSGHWSGLTVF